MSMGVEFTSLVALSASTASTPHIQVSPADKLPEASSTASVTSLDTLVKLDVRTGASFLYHVNVTSTFPFRSDAAQEHIRFSAVVAVAFTPILVFVPELLFMAGSFLHFSDLLLQPPLVSQEQTVHLLISVPLLQYFGLVAEHW
jgi:hypothetical protein